jgi:hypothetical protein
LSRKIARGGGSVLFEALAMTPVFIMPLALSFALAVPTGPVVLSAAAPYWPPPERSKKAPVKKAHPHSGATSTERLERQALGDDDDDETDEKPPARNQERASERAPERDQEDAMEDRRATTVRRAPARPARHRDEEEESDDEVKTVSLPVVAPRILTLALGGSLVGRRFQFDAPLQQEKTFPRPGVATSLELYPLLLAKGWYSHLGIGASYAREFGSAGLTQADGGTLNYSVTEQRWALDLRYALVFGDSFVLTVIGGYGRSGYDVQRNNETTNPSMCTGNVTQVCVPDIKLSHMTLGLQARVAFSPTFGMSLGMSYLPALSVGRSQGGIGAEAPPSVSGFGGELAATWQFSNWLAARAAVPVVRYGYSWTSTAVQYRSASEMYYGTVFGLVAWTN